jgi:hypothetical protein
MKRLPTFLLGVFASFGTILLASCDSDSGNPTDPVKRHPVDESKTTLIRDFTPKDASVRTILFIDGENFGTKLENIKVYVGGKEAPVTGSNGKTITAMVPRNAAETIVDPEKGLATSTLRVEVYKADGQTIHFDETFEEPINIKISTNVGTLVGKRDPATGNSSRIDGTFEEAEFQSPWWLQLARNKQGEKVLLVHDGITQGESWEGGNLLAIRMVNLETRMVSTTLTQSQIGLNKGLSIAMDPSRDTLFLFNDNGKGSWNDRHAMPAIYYALRADDYKNSRPYQYAQCSYSGVWMTDGTFYYNTWDSGMLLRGRGEYNASVGIWDGTRLFSTYNNNGAHQYIAKHPEENYIYITGTTRRINKVPYDKENKTFINSVSTLAGEGEGFQEGTGSQARFGLPRQGVFVKNPDYDTGVAGEELYDFYVADQGAECIWKVTPQGVCTVFAGRGSRTLNNDVSGWIDGDPIETARFNKPTGIAYDEETGIFYIADRDNRRIRTIMIE